MTDKERLEEIESRVWKEHCTYAADDDLIREGYRYILSDEDYEWLIKQAEKTEKYREALEFYAGGNHYSDKLYDDKIILLDDGETARKVLEGDDNE